ncbi:MAG: carbohydrate-binding domain-containing protein [Clostridium sp.]|nr:carbohydrate-binding domain-containing protein [Clostridium sp.]
MKSRLVFSYILSLTLLLSVLSGCTRNAADAGGTPSIGDSANGAIDPSKISDAATAAEMVNNAVLQGTDAKITAVTASFSDRDLSGKYDERVIDVDLDEQNADYEITTAGTYVMTGTLQGHQIRVSVGDQEKAQIVLNNAHITSADGPAIYIRSGDKVFITLAEGTQNSLTDTTTYTLDDGDEPNACLFSKSDLTINGTGTLNITGTYNHGIHSKDDISLVDCTLNITAVNDAIKGKDFVQVASGTYNLNAGSDGLVSSNANDTTLGYIVIQNGTFNIIANNDGIQAETILQIENGTFNIQSGGGSVNASYTTDGGMNNGWGAWGGGNGGFPPSGGRNNDFGAEGSGGMQPGESVPDSASNSATTTDGATMSDGTTTSDSAATSDSAKGLKSGVGLLIMAGTFTLDTSDDALHTNGDLGIVGGTFDIASGDDGIHADDACVILDGKIAISQSYEAIEGNSITVFAGEFDLTAMDDGFNAAGGNDASAMGARPGRGNFDTSTSSYLRFVGGTVYLDASGDGLDSNGYLYVEGGNVYVSGPTNSGNGALDYGIEAKITGGTVVAIGAMGMAQNFSDSSTQCAFLVNFNGNVAGGEKLTLTDASGTDILSFTPSKNYQCAVISSPDLVKGDTYTVTAGSYSTDITLEDTITGGGMMGGPGSGGGFGFW